jgi:hypothetical protein
MIEGEGGRLPLSMHLHNGNMEQLHFEPPRRECRSLESTLNLLSIDLDPDSVVFGGGHEGFPQAGTHRENETHKVRVFFQMPSEENLREESVSSMLDYQLRDGEKFMLAYGAYDDDELQGMMDQIGWPSGVVPEHPSG